MLLLITQSIMTRKHVCIYSGRVFFYAVRYSYFKQNIRLRRIKVCLKKVTL